MAEQQPKPKFWHQPQFWGAISAIGMVLGMTCPFWPPPYNAACSGGAQALQKTGEAGRKLTTQPPSSSSPAPCTDGALTHDPAFCRCVDGAWRDYFDAGTPCGG